MRLRYAVAAAIILLLLQPACRNSSHPDAATGPELPPIATNTVLRIHWTGKRQIALNGGAFYFNRLWDLQETRALELRAFNSLATAPWRILRGEESLANAPVVLSRDLVESLKQEEWYLEIRSATSATDLPQLVFAIRLPESYAAKWHSNLAMVIDSLTGASPLSNHAGLPGWAVLPPGSKREIQLVRRRGWTFVSFAASPHALSTEMRRRLDTNGSLFGDGTWTNWLQADVDLEWASKRLGFGDSARRLPKASMKMGGDGADVFTSMTLMLPDPLPNRIEPWTIPSDLVHEPLTSIVLARQTRAILSGTPSWNAIGLGEAPDQLSFWSTGDNPFQIYLAALMPDAKSQMKALTDRLLTQANPWLTNNGPSVEGSGIPLFEELPEGGVRWTLKDVWPFVKPATSANGTILFAGLTPEQSSGATASINAARLRPVLAETNLIYWEWESTPARLIGWLPVLQTARVLAHHPPLPDKCPSIAWLTALESRLRDTETRVTQTAPNKLELFRKSTIGLNAFELHLLADWLESPEFPHGLHTFSAPAPDQKH